ncbi:MAG: hypothetical protein ACI9UK_000019 [Candidatus Krumholzibacteriia bacterium]|jgi:hypothetical protein
MVTVALSEFEGVLMKSLIAVLCAVLVTGVFFPNSASAQVPNKFENLQVLPKDIIKGDLVKVMRSASLALGVRCSACHVEKEPGNFMSTDWPSDELEMKETARGMMKMVAEINANLLPAATGKHDFQVSCITCHRGVAEPYLLTEVVLKTTTKDGAEAGETRYRELREEYYGSGSYDFGPMSLTTVAESLIAEHADMAGARQFLNLNLEMHPEFGDTYLMLAQLDMAGGDDEAARANIERALEIDPESRQAKRMLSQLE